VGFVVDKVALGQIFSEYFGSPPNFYSPNCSTVIIVYLLALVQGTVGQKGPQYQADSFSPH
jgi:hypothetical protein